MESLHLRITAALLYFILPGSVETKSHWIPSDTSHHLGCRWEGNLIVNCSFTGISAIPKAVAAAELTADLSHNNIRTLPHATGRSQEWAVKHLNLSNNLISELSLAAAFRNLPSLETLNLDGNALSALRLGLPAAAPAEQGDAGPLLPALRALALQRNRLGTVPQGLGILQSLQTVHLASNDILQIDVNDFQNCSQLKKIYLQDNKITKIHPEAFKDLNNLQVVDLRGNVLTTLPPRIFNNLNIFQLGVGSTNNPCTCSCDLNTFKYLIHFLLDSTRKRWSISRNKSANILWKLLLPLSTFNLNCNDSVSFKTTVIPMGKTSVLNCHLDNTQGNGVFWWTPVGRISRDAPLPPLTLDKESNLAIHNADRTAEGFYMCIYFNTTRKKFLIYDIQVKEKLSRSLVRKTRDTTTVFRQGTTRQDLVLATCLSVLVTFVLAFCLGAFARPYLGKLWSRMRRNKSSASQHVYSNEAFSNETLGRECTASIPTNTRSNLFSCDEDSSKSTRSFPAETSSLHQSVIYSNIGAPNTGEEDQMQCSNETKAKHKSVFASSKANTTSNDHYINVNPNAQSSVEKHYGDSNELAPRSLTRQDILLREDSSYANGKALERSSRQNADLYSAHIEPSHSDLPFAGQTALPFPGMQTHVNAQDPRNTEITNKSQLLQSNITEDTVDSPEWKEVISSTEPRSTSVVLPRTQMCQEELGLNNKKDKISDAGDFILPNSHHRFINCEDLSAYLTSDNSSLEYYKRGGATKQEDLADLFGDSSSDEGVPFRMSDCSSLSDVELGQPPSNTLRGCQSSLETADANNETERYSTAAEPPSPAEHQPFGKGEHTDEDDSDTTASYGSDTSTSQTESPYTDKHSDCESDCNTIIFSHQNVPGMFKSSTHPESPIQNFTSGSTCKHRTSFNDTSAASKRSPMSASHTEDAPAKEADLSPSQFSVQAQHFQRFRLTEQEENEADTSAESTEQSSSEEDNSEEDITLRRHMRTPEKDRFTFAPNDFGSSQVVSKSSNIAIDESTLQSQPQSTGEGHIMVIPDIDDSLPQGKQVEAPNAQTMHKGFTEGGHEEHTEVQDGASWDLPPETQPHDAAAPSHHPDCSGKAQSIFSTHNYSQWDQSEENAYSSPLPQRSFSENIQYSSWSFPQTGEKRDSRTSDSSDTEDTTWIALENYPTTVVNLQNPSEKLDQKNKTNLNQGQFFVKKKRAFDGFANVLQSRSNFNK